MFNVFLLYTVKCNVSPALHCRKTLFTSVHNFVHLNLCISLLLSYSVFVAGVSTAVGDTVSLSCTCIYSDKKHESIDILVLGVLICICVYIYNRDIYIYIANLPTILVQFNYLIEFQQNFTIQSLLCVKIVAL